jgi:hypothetical protein
MKSMKFEIHSTNDKWVDGSAIWRADFWTDEIQAPLDQGFKHGLPVDEVCRVEGSLYSGASCRPLGNVNPIDITSTHSLVVDKESVFVNVGYDFPFDRKYHLYLRIFYTSTDAGGAPEPKKPRKSGTHGVQKDVSRETAERE